MANNPVGNMLNGLPAEKRQKYTQYGIMAIFMVAALFFYYGTDQDEKNVVVQDDDPVVIGLGDDRLEDDIRDKVEKQHEEQTNQNVAQDERIGLTEEELEVLRQEQDTMKKALLALSASGVPQNGVTPSQSGPTPGQSQQNALAAQNPNQWANNGSEPLLAGDQQLPPPIEFIGDIGGIKVEAPLGQESEEEKNSKKFYLPPGFMPATLLTGLNAKTVEAARNNPEPIMLRVQAPAILPNEVRAELEGCFVTAHGYGSLASERVEARLVSISCVDYEGKGIIDAEITGIVADSDGVKGIIGHPVTKMGANVARLFMAGVFEGAGNAFASSSTTNSLSPLGTTQTLDPDRIGRAGLGQGVAEGSEELKKIYVDLVRQSSPVLEVGPAKDVTVVITEGAWLEIRNYDI